MAKFILITAVVLLVAVVSCHAGIRDLAKDLPWVRAINRKLCESDAHPDNVAQQFFECYQEDKTPGGGKFVECQQEVYGVHMDSKENIDKVCAAPRDNFRLYVGCITTNLVSSGQRVSETLHKLNTCQGGVLGVEAPTIPDLSVLSPAALANIDRIF